MADDLRGKVRISSFSYYLRTGRAFVSFANTGSEGRASANTRDSLTESRVL